MKKVILCASFFILLFASGIDFDFIDPIKYALFYQIGRITIYHFESKKIDWKENFKSFFIFLSITTAYHVCSLILIWVGFKPVKFLSIGLESFGAILFVSGLIYITFIVPYKILTQKSKRHSN